MALAESSTRSAAGAAMGEWLQRIHPAWALVALILVIMPAIANGFVLVQIFGWSFMLGTIALSLMFLAGYGGMVSLAQMTIAGFAGYMVAIFGVSGLATLSIGWPWWLATPMALVLAMISGAIIGALAVRTEGIYTIMITLAIAAAFFYFTNENYALFNGHTGINSVPTPQFLGVDWKDAIPFYYLTLGVAVLCCWAVAYVGRAPFGLALQGIRDNPRRMAALGFNVYAHRVAAYVFAGPDRGSRRRAAGLEQRRDRPRHGQRIGGDRHPRHCRSRGHRQPDRAVHWRLDLCGFEDLRAGLSGSRRPRRQPVSAPHRARLSRHRPLFARRRPRSLGALAQSHALRARRAGKNRAAAMDSVAQRLSAVGSANALELRGVTRLFGALAALVDVSLTVRPGERRAVLGSNGAGKTTLFNCITGDFLPTSGTIRFFGEDVTSFPPYERIRRGLRRTYQISALFPGLSVLDNVYLACRGVSRGRYSLLQPRRNDALVNAAENLIQAVHLTPIKSRLVAELAYGQQRQLEIALALAGAPRFILFDEPAAGLSPTERVN